MKRFILIIAVLIIIACSTQMQVYDYRPVIEISGDTTEIVFNVPDNEPDGWHSGDGMDTETIILTLKETAGTEAYITDMKYSVISYENESVSERVIKLSSPVELTGSEEKYTLYLEIDEETAMELDEDNGIVDNVGPGSIKIECSFYDKSGGKYSSVPFYIPIKVLKP